MDAWIKSGHDECVLRDQACNSRFNFQRARDTPPHSRGCFRPSCARITTLDENRGRRECRMRSAPAAACAKSTRVSNHRYAATGIPCAMVLRLISCSPREPGSFALVVRGSLHDLSASVRAPGPHVFAVRTGALVQRHRLRPPHPASTSVTIASRRSCEDGTAGTLQLIWVSGKEKYFCERG